MVSKLNILKTYYHLPLEDQFSFIYEGKHYYLTNKPFPLYYQKYISLLQINPFKIIQNIYQQNTSQEYILYQLQNIPIDIKKIISLSFIHQGTKTVEEIKKEWIQYYEAILIYTPLNSLEYQAIYYTLFTLCQLSIELLNYYFKSYTQISCSFQHLTLSNHIDAFYTIENIKIDIFINDLVELYFDDLITIEQLRQIIKEKNLSVLDLKIILCRSIYPYHYLHQTKSYLKEKRKLDSFLNHLHFLIKLLNKYIFIPDIDWIK